MIKNRFLGVLVCPTDIRT